MVLADIDGCRLLAVYVISNATEVIKTMRTFKSRNLAALILGVAMCSPAMGQNHRNAGTAIGGVAGALAGAAIGDHNDEPLAGALIGGAVGMVTGAIVGNAKDNEIQRAQAAQQYRYQQQMKGAVSTYDITMMVRSGISPQVIVNQMHQYGVQKRPEVSDIIWLHQQGVPEEIITAMQSAPVGSPGYVTSGPSIAAPAPVVVEEYHYVSPPAYYVQPRIYPYHHHHHHHRSYPARSSYGFGFSYGR